MKNIFKKISILGLCASMLAGCSNSGSSSSSTSTAGASTDEETTITIWHTFTGGQDEVLNTIAQDFEAENPNIHVNVVGGYNQNDFESTVQDAVVNGVGPNLVFNFVSFAKNFDGYDMLISFDDYFTQDYKSMVSQGIYDVATGFEDGKVHMIATYTTSQVLFYNKAIFDEAGVEVPNTWDELKEACKTIYEKTGVVGFSADSLQEVINAIILQSHDGKYLDESTKKTLFNDEETVKWVEWWAEGVRDGYFQVAPTTGDYNSSDLNNGAIASYIGSCAGLPFLDLSNINGEVGVNRMPYIDEDHKQVTVSNRSIIGFKKSDAEDAAVAKFAEYFITRDYEWVEELSAYSPYYSIQETDEYKTYVDGNIALKAVGDQINDAVTIPTVSGIITLRDELKKVMTGAADPSFDAKTALENAITVGEAAMNE